MLWFNARARAVLYHFRTLWLFTYSDLVSILWPELAFGILSALSGPVLTTNSAPDTTAILQRLPHLALWTWTNLLVNCVANQRMPHSILEDAANKPWRPLPAQRLTATQARRLLLLAIPLALLVSVCVGALFETAALIILTYMYNDLGLADESYLLRNVINALAFVSYGSGTTRVASGGDEQVFLSTRAGLWFFVIGAVVASTLQLQDMYDQEGDALRGRSTAPLVLGDRAARWSIALPVVLWSFVCPALWELPVTGFVAPVTIGGIIAVRIVAVRSVVGDRTTFRFWCLWMVAMYILPMLKYYRAMDHEGLPE
ncbi:hypothetical protein MMC17_008735 [Xylographa soralifera]|nr:hypothetical protein [Xylographa soralifera]